MYIMQNCGRDAGKTKYYISLLPRDPLDGFILMALRNIYCRRAQNPYIPPLS